MQPPDLSACCASPVASPKARCNIYLQTAELFRNRATEAIDIIQHLQTFSRTGDFSDLGDPFQSTTDLDSAAVRA